MAKKKKKRTGSFFRKKTNEGIKFEKKMCRLLKKNGFRNVKNTRASGDFGVDILARKRRRTYAIQCKYYSGNVGVDAVQQASCGCQYYEADIPVVLTNSYFTKNAMELAEQTEVELWDGDWIRAHKKWNLGLLFLLLFLAAGLYAWFKIDGFQEQIVRYVNDSGLLEQLKRYLKMLVDIVYKKWYSTSTV